LWINEAVTPLGAHAVERALSVLPALGVPPRPVDFGAAKLFPGAQPPVAVEGPFVLLLPGAGWQNKRLSTRQWGALAHRLWQSKGLKSWIPCGPGEEALAQEIVAASQGAARSLGLVPLPALAALMRQARLVLGGDSGPIHLAHALGAPVLAVHGPTDPRLHGPFEAPEGAFYRPLPCSPCYKRFAEPKACLLTLSVAEIAEHAFRQLDT
jgi:ADP-heptose:LPS heptosyltransferase